MNKRRSEIKLSAHDEVLLRGLVDWVALERVHDYVLRENPERPVSTIQSKTLELVRSLVSEGMFVLGDLSGEGGRFVAWDRPLDESLNRIRVAYVTNFDDRNTWPWYCWLDLTDKGQHVAEAIRAAEPAQR